MVRTHTPLPGQARRAKHPPVALRMAILVLSVACEPRAAARDPGDVVTPVPTRLEAHYRMIGSVRLEQPDSALIVRVSGIDRNSAGLIALGDASEGNVKLFSESGRLLRILGRKGGGPGEFREPRYPRFADDTTLHIADTDGGRLTVITTSGRLVRTLQLAKLAYLSGFALDGHGGYLVASEDPDGYVLLHFDSTGKQIGRFLKIRDVLPRGMPDSPYWRNVRNFYLSALHDTAYVTLTYSDTLWRVSLLDSVETATAITPPGYEIPAAPKTELKSLEDLKTWSHSLQLTVTPTAGEAGVVVNFVKGILNYGDPNTAVVRLPTADWVAIPQAPAFLLADGRSLVTLASAGDSASADVVLGLYEPLK
jgi:hypothetical protein